MAPMRSPSPSAAKSGVVAAFAHGFLQRRDVRLDGLGIDAAKKRIARAANFIAGDAVARASIRGAVRARRRAWDRRQSAARRLLARLSQSTSLSMVSRYGRQDIERLNEIRFAAEERGTPFAERLPAPFRFARRCEGSARTAVAGFEFDAVPAAGLWLAVIMMPPAARAGAPAAKSRARGRASSASQTGVPVMAMVSAATRAKSLGAEAIVVADQHAAWRASSARTT